MRGSPGMWRRATPRRLLSPGSCRREARTRRAPARRAPGARAKSCRLSASARASAKRARSEVARPLAPLQRDGTLERHDGRGRSVEREKRVTRQRERPTRRRRRGRWPSPSPARRWRDCRARAPRPPGRAPGARRPSRTQDAWREHGGCGGGLEEREAALSECRALCIRIARSIRRLRQILEGSDSIQKASE